MVIESSSLSPDGKLRIQMAFEYMEQREFDNVMMGKMTDMIADDYVKNHSSEIMGKFDQQAIANIAIAKVAQKVADLYMKPKVEGPEDDKKH